MTHFILPVLIQDDDTKNKQISSYFSSNLTTSVYITSVLTKYDAAIWHFVYTHILIMQNSKNDHNLVTF